MNRMINVGIIGTGRMAKFHLEVLNAFRNVNIQAIASTKRGKKRRIEMCQEYNIPNQYSDYNDMLERGNLDAVFIVVNIEKIFSIAKGCLTYGINSFIEKPPGLFAKETRELARIAKEQNVVNMVGLQRRFYSHFLYAKNFLDSNGGLCSIVVEAPERFDEIKKKGKFSKLVLSRWLIANGIHCVDLLQYFGGKIENVIMMNNSWNESIHPDSLHAIVKFKNGVIGHYFSNWMSPGGWSVKLYGESFRIDIQPLERGYAIFSDGKKFDLPIEEADRKYKPGVYAQDHFFLEVCRGKKALGFPAATLHDVSVTMGLAEDLMSA